MIRRLAISALHLAAVHAYHLCVLCSLAARRLQGASMRRVSVIEPIGWVTPLHRPKNTVPARGSAERN